MLIFAIDDEKAMLEELHEAIAQAQPDAEILDFTRASDALAAIIEDAMRPDVVFSDIEIPGMDGLSLAVRIRNVCPQASIVYCTGYSQYALEAYRRHVNGYLMKPIDASMIREELDHLTLLPSADAPGSAKEKLYARCFGDFEVFWQGKPLLFERRQTKELFAVLIDRRGASCTIEELAAILWENDSDMRAMKNRLRQLIADLRKSLDNIGMAQLLIRRRGLLAIDTELLECDYYRVLEGDMDVINTFQGEYMKQYYWAEDTRARLFFREM